MALAFLTYIASSGRKTYHLCLLRLLIYRQKTATAVMSVAWREFAMGLEQRGKNQPTRFASLLHRYRY
jgi:hypothetical protein